MEDKLRQSMLKSVDAALRANGLNALQDAIDVVQYVNSQVNQIKKEEKKEVKK